MTSEMKITQLEQDIHELKSTLKFLFRWFVPSLQYLRDPISNSNSTLCPGFPQNMLDSTDPEIQEIVKIVKGIKPIRGRPEDNFEGLDSYFDLIE